MGEGAFKARDFGLLTDTPRAPPGVVVRGRIMSVTSPGAPLGRRRASPPSGYSGDPGTVGRMRSEDTSGIPLDHGETDPMRSWLGFPFFTLEQPP